MRIILTDKELGGDIFPNDVHVERVSLKTLEDYNHNIDVVAIAGSRAMACRVNELDFPKLGFFQLTSAGFDGVPLDELSEKGISVANAGSVYSVPIAETVILGMLLLAKRLRKNPNNRRLKIQRQYNEISELAEKKVIILGAGSIGTEIAKRLSSFDMTIHGYAQHEGERPFFEEVITGRENLLNVISQYDYIISTLPDDESTKSFIDVEMLSKMKKTAFIINVGRKAVFNQEDLYNALHSQKIAGAVLDMFEKIPNPITNKFRRLNNVVVLPGVSAISQEVNVRLNDHMRRNLLSFLQGEPITNVIILKR